MNGQWLGSRSIRTNWATRKPQAPYGAADGKAPSNGAPPMKSQSGGGAIKPLQYDEMFRQASPSNCTVYCGGITDCDENTLRRTFSTYGRILEIRFFRDKGYAFVRYDNKESACSAIVAVHGTQIAGQMAKCSWGKENPNGVGPGPSMANSGAMQGANYGVPPSGMGGEGVPPDQLQYYQQQQQQYAYAYMSYNPQYMQYYAQQQYGGGYGYPQQAPPPPPNH